MYIQILVCELFFLLYGESILCFKLPAPKEKFAYLLLRATLERNFIYYWRTKWEYNPENIKTIWLIAGIYHRLKISPAELKRNKEAGRSWNIVIWIYFWQMWNIFKGLQILIKVTLVCNHKCDIIINSWKTLVVLFCFCFLFLFLFFLLLSPVSLFLFS